MRYAVSQAEIQRHLQEQARKRKQRKHHRRLKASLGEQAIARQLARLER